MRIRDHKPRTAGSRLTSPPHLTERKTEAQAEKFLVHRLQRGGTQSPLTNTRLLSPGEILNSSPPGGSSATLPLNKSQATVTSPTLFVSIRLSSVAAHLVMWCTAGTGERPREPPSGASSGLTPLVRLVRLPLLDSLLASPPPPNPYPSLCLTPQPRSHQLGSVPTSQARGLHKPAQRQHLPSQAGTFLPSQPGSWPGSTLQRGCRPCSTRAPPPLL